LFSKDIQLIDQTLRKILILFLREEQFQVQAPRVKTNQHQKEKVRIRRMQELLILLMH